MQYDEKVEAFSLERKKIETISMKKSHEPLLGWWEL
jgi:hypothetical protein